MPSNNTSRPSLDWLQNELDMRHLSVADLARIMTQQEGHDETSSKYEKRLAKNNAVVGKVLRRERDLGPDLAKRIAAALQVPQTVIFEKAGLLDGGNDGTNVPDDDDALYADLRAAYCRLTTDSDRWLAIRLLLALAFHRESDGGHGVLRDTMPTKATPRKTRPST